MERIELDESNNIDFEHGLAREFWGLDEFVCYVLNENPWYRSTDANGKVRYLFKLPDKTNSRLFKSAHKNILDGNLSPHDGYSDDDSYFLKPRQWIDWVLENHKGVICNELLKYLDYSYWIEDRIKQSSFNGEYKGDEFVTLLTSKNCPFPHERENISENKDAKDMALKLKELRYVIDIHNLSNKKLSFEAVSEILHLLDTEYPKELNRIIDFFKEKKKKESERETEEWKEHLKTTINTPACSLKNAIFLLHKKSLSWVNMTKHTDFNKIGYLEFKDLHEIFGSSGKNYRAWLNNFDAISFIEGAIKVKLLPIEYEEENIIESSVKPKVFFKWCLNENVPLDDEVKELIEESLKEKKLNCNELNKERENKVKSDFPKINATDTESWKDDVKMAFIDYYNTNKTTPKAVDLCSFIKEMKNENDIYAQHITFIKLNKTLKVIKGSMQQEIKWDTFRKAISYIKKNPE